MPSPPSPPPLRTQADALFKAGRRTEAIAAYSQVLAAQPADPDGWFNLAVLLRQAGQVEGALDAYQKALDHKVSAAHEVHLNRSVLYLDGLRDSAAAARELQQALALKPDYLPALINLASLREDEGKRADARELYDRALALAPDDADALVRRAGLEPRGQDASDLVGRLQAARRRPGLPPQAAAAIGFALGRLHDQAGDFDAAFAAYAAANASAPRQPYDRAADTARVAATIAAYTTAPPAIAAAAGRAPVFIVGMFRSGSTLVEQVLASHSNITSGGELDLIPRMARYLGSDPKTIASASDDQIEAMRTAYLDRAATLAPAGQVLTDKRPDNVWHVGLIKQLFPDAKIIHTRRQPLDNCLSVWFLHLAPEMNYAGDLIDCGHHLLAERAVSDHWKSLWPGDILTVDYEDVIADQRGQTERLLDFLGLAWEDACLDFHRAETIVRTASVWQVREKLHDRSVGRWRNYATHLGDLEALFAANKA